MTTLKICILAGGKGTRLWPLSRENYPKQFIPIFEGQTLFQLTLKRALKITDYQNVYIITSKNFEDLIKRDISSIEPEVIKNVIYEPVGKNTLPAVILGSFYIEKDDIILVLPSDHFIENEDIFINDVKTAYEEAKKGNIVIFGIKPYQPETGYGYIKVRKQKKIHEVLEFIEKPDIVRAKQYYKDSCFYWNAGIFMFPKALFLSFVKEFEPDIFKSFKKGKKYFLENFRDLKAQSIDYGIMEKIDKRFVKMLEAQFSWSDLGSFESMYDFFDKSKKRNFIIGRGELIEEESYENFIINGDKLIVTLGIKNLIVVDTDDVLLVMQKGEGQKLKNVVEFLIQNNRKEVYYNKQGFRPWGTYTVLLEGERYKIKKITVYPGSSLSLQMHHHRSEHWVVIKGTAKVTINDEVHFVHENESIYIPKSTKHRLENPGKVNLEVIEVQNGEYLDEDDIIRFLDNYGRK